MTYEQYKIQNLSFVSNNHCKSVSSFDSEDINSLISFNGVLAP